MTEVANHAEKQPWPSLEWASWVFDRASFVLVGSLIVGAVATFAIVRMGIVKERHWDLAREQAGTRIAKLLKDGEQLRKDAEELRKETAEANAHAAQAQLELQRLKSWRMVDGNKFKAALTGITPPKNVEILYVPECSDCHILGGMAATILGGMNWPVTFEELKKIENPSQAWMKGVPATLQHRANPTGLTFLLKEQPDPLRNSLLKGLGLAFGYTAFGAKFDADDTLADGVVRIVIAPKL